MIDGIVWEDSNRNAALDWIERGIGDITVDLYRDEDQNAALSAADTHLASTATSKANGFFAFAGLPHGHYLVTLGDSGHVLGGYRRTTPADPIPVDLEAGREAAAVIFGYIRMPGPQSFLPACAAGWAPPAGASSSLTGRSTGGFLP